MNAPEKRCKSHTATVWTYIANNSFGSFNKTPKQLSVNNNKVQQAQFGLQHGKRADGDVLERYSSQCLKVSIIRYRDTESGFYLFFPLNVTWQCLFDGPVQNQACDARVCVCVLY